MKEELSGNSLKTVLKTYLEGLIINLTTLNTKTYANSSNNPLTECIKNISGRVTTSLATTNNSRILPGAQFFNELNTDLITVLSILNEQNLLQSFLSYIQPNKDFTELSKSLLKQLQGVINAHKKRCQNNSIVVFSDAAIFSSGVSECSTDPIKIYETLSDIVEGIKDQNINKYQRYLTTKTTTNKYQ